MLIKTGKLSRRAVMRGLLGGGAVSVSVPLLDIFLDGNGTALADGRPLPARFGTWFWGLGVNPQTYVPETVGKITRMPAQLAVLEGVKEHVNVFSNFNVVTDGKPNLCHYTGWVILRSGGAPAGRGDLPDQSLDIPIAELIGGQTPFPMINATAAGARDSYSFKSADAINPAEVSAIELYTKIFGPDFQDPNAPTFTPNPKILLRKGAVSAVMEQKAQLNQQLGAADRARLDQYFTSLREIENRLEMQLQRPPPAPSCVLPKGAPRMGAQGRDTETVSLRHRAMTDLLMMALACNQTNVFNMVYSGGTSGLTRKGSERTHHVITHEEPIDPKLGIQVEHSWFVERALDEWAYFVEALARTPEGDGRLIDNTLVYSHTETLFAKAHSLSGTPMMTAGRVRGKTRSGLHIDGKGEVATQLGYTLQRVFGVPTGSWGQQSMTTSREIGEMLV